MLAATSVSCTLGLVIGCASLWHQMSRVQSELTSRHLRVARTGAEPTLGTRIRDARVARGLGVRELARIADCSASLVSQIERGRANPSVSTLYSLADALGISVASLFRSGDGRRGAPATIPGEPQRVVGRAAPDEGRSAAPYAALLEAPSTARRPSTIEEAVVLRRAQRRSIDLERGVHWELLLPRPERDVDFLEVRYEPHGGSALKEHAIRHHGREMAVIIEGELSAQIAFERYRLEPGDSLSFTSTTPHRYWNPGATQARAIFVVLGGWER